MGRGAKEQPMFEMWSDRPNQTSSLAFQSILGSSSRSYIMGFIDNEDIEFSGIGNGRWQAILYRSDSFSTLHPIHRGNQSRKGSPRICMYTTFPSQPFDVLGVYDSEFQTEFFPHFGLPFHL